MQNQTPSIVLFRPQMGENIGAAARGILNFGLDDLRLIAPRDGWPNQAAIDMSSGAFDVMPAPQIFDHAPDALKDCHYIYGTTARRRDMTKPVLDIRGAIADAKTRINKGQKIAFAFGPERTGLENDDLSLCHAIVHIPTNSSFSSINLAQSVLLTAYEWGTQNKEQAGSIIDMGDSFPVPHEKLEEFLLRLEQELEDKNFFRDSALKPTMIRNIRNMFMRTELSDQETRTLHGMVSALIGNKLT